MKYTYAPDEYLKQLKAYYALEQTSFSAGADRETVLNALEERSKKKRGVADTVNTMIQEYIETFEQRPDLLTDEDAAKLEALYTSLTDPKTGREMCCSPAGVSVP